ncbi:transposase [Saccharopolyspora spinosporotrichia]
MKPKQSFSFEFKLEVVRRFLDGEATTAELAREYALSSPKLVETWVRKYRREGEDALRPSGEADRQAPRNHPRASSARCNGCGRRTSVWLPKTPT